MTEHQFWALLFAILLVGKTRRQATGDTDDNTPLWVLVLDFCIVLCLAWGFLSSLVKVAVAFG